MSIGGNEDPAAAVAAVSPLPFLPPRLRPCSRFLNHIIIALRRFITREPIPSGFGPSSFEVTDGPLAVVIVGCFGVSGVGVVFIAVVG